ncbi:MAG: Holliday junction branch migration protein RuvA, partial [Patescibacteria group bacterium]
NKNETSLWTHLAVRENALDLYGFLNKQDLDFFSLLITISGIGPKSALGILSVASVGVLRKAISSEDTSYLVKVSGIGKKSADKIVLELKDKLGKEYESDGTTLKEESDVVETLKTLGYKSYEIREALKKMPKDASGTSQRVKEALKILGK